MIKINIILLVYGIIEDVEISYKFSLSYLMNICKFNKISNTINIHLKDELPLQISFCLDYSSELDQNNENQIIYKELSRETPDMVNRLSYYLASKIMDDEEDDFI